METIEVNYQQLSNKTVSIHSVQYHNLKKTHKHSPPPPCMILYHRLRDMLTKSQEKFLTMLFYSETSIRIPSPEEGESVNI